MTVLDAFSLKHIIWWEDRGHARLASTLNLALISSVFVSFTVSFLSRHSRQRERHHALSICSSVCLSPNCKNEIFSKIKQLLRSSRLASVLVTCNVCISLFSVSSFSQRYIVNAALLRPHFRLSVLLLSVSRLSVCLTSVCPSASRLSVCNPRVL